MALISSDGEHGECDAPSGALIESCVNGVNETAESESVDDESVKSYYLVESACLHREGSSQL